MIFVFHKNFLINVKFKIYSEDVFTVTAGFPE